MYANAQHVFINYLKMFSYIPGIQNKNIQMFNLPVYNIAIAAQIHRGCKYTVSSGAFQYKELLVIRLKKICKHRFHKSWIITL